jgi:hypothetical protein
MARPWKLSVQDFDFGQVSFYPVNKTKFIAEALDKENLKYC